MNMAALWKLPVIFAVVNNQYGMGTRIDHASASLKFAERAETFGVRGVEVDGMDVEAVWNAAHTLYESARRGDGPGLIVANAYRFYGHGRKDPSPYRSKEEESEWRLRDPIATYRKRLAESNVVGAEAFLALEAEVKAEVDKAVEWASASPPPNDDELYSDVYVNED
jgi:pyruvate dehydrogenase E1 component alpha subunit